MKNIYVFRHGQTDMNAAGVWQGQGVDLFLNETGIEQAQKLAQSLKDKKLDVIYCSPLKRAYHTAKIVQMQCRVPIVMEQDLIEGNFGIAEGQSKEKIRELYPEQYAAWRNLNPEFLDARFDGGESKREIQERIMRALQKFSETSYENIAVSTHSAVTRAMLLHFGLKMDKIPNAECIKLEAEGGRLRLAENPMLQKVEIRKHGGSYGEK